MKRLLIFLIAVVAFTLGVTATSQHPAELAQDPFLDGLDDVTATSQHSAEHRFRVQVGVTADENIKGLITSYINRELRSLRDVEIVDKDPRWLLEVIAVEISTKGGYKSGVALSIVVLEKFDNSYLKSLMRETYEKDLVVLLTSNLYAVLNHWLRVGSHDDLRSICDGIVADFDTKHLEESRRSLRRLKQ